MEGYFAKIRKTLDKNMNQMQEASKKMAIMYDIIDTQMNLCVDSTIKTPDYLRNFKLLSSKPIAKAPTGRNCARFSKLYAEEVEKKHDEVMASLDKINHEAKTLIEGHFTKLTTTLQPDDDNVDDWIFV